MRPDIQLRIHNMLLRPALMHGSGAWVLGVTLRDKMKCGDIGRKEEKEIPTVRSCYQTMTM